MDKKIMNKSYRHSKIVLMTLIFVLTAQLVFSQDTPKFKLAEPTTWMISSSYSASANYSIIHNPTKKDFLFCKKYVKWIERAPTKTNYEKYYALACSLWELGRLKEAELMFLKIVDSQEPFYVNTYKHSSDIIGDTTVTLYGYGSYTTNYKNNACQYLTKIYIEQKKFKKALTFITYADKKYVVEQNCGTGYNWHREEIDGLYSLAYEGLELYDSIINMFLPHYPSHSSGILTRALKKVYSQQEINRHLQIAVNSIVCVVDTFQSSTFVTQNYGEKNETTTEIRYVSGSATMNLFDKKINLPTPHLNEGETVSREFFVKEFKESGFYSSLIDDD